MKNQEMKTNKSRTYLMAFVVVTVLNVALAVYLLQISFAQTNENRFKDQPPVKVELTTQSDSPLRITVINVDNSETSSQTVNFTIQNISNKLIKGYVILGSGKIVTHFFPVKSFQPRAFNRDELSLERENIKTDEPFLLSIDYVEFDDGSSWGEDKQRQSDNIAGGRAGVKAATEQLKKIINQREITTLTAFFEIQLADVDVPLPESVQSEKWQSGFRNGYKSIVGFLKGQREKGVEELSKKLDEIRDNQIERRQKQ